VSRPTPTATDLIAQATEPCHHRREPFGPCGTCLDDQVSEFINGMVPEEELVLAKASIEQLEADVRNHEGHNEALSRRISELLERQKSIKDELGEGLTAMRSELLDRLNKLMEETESAEDNL
jgi:hypothetical protein